MPVKKNPSYPGTITCLPPNMLSIFYKTFNSQVSNGEDLIDRKTVCVVVGRTSKQASFFSSFTIIEMISNVAN